MSDTSRFDIHVGAEMEKVRTTSSSIEMFEWFQRLWGLAILAHIIGNPRVGQVAPSPTLLGLVTLVTGLLAVTAVLVPYDRRILLGLAGLVPATVFLEAPFLSNHWTLAGLVSIALLIALLSTDSWNWFSSTVRGMHLVFYLFAAFAKLNSDFFDPSASCSVVFANQSLSAAGLSTIDSSSAIAAVLPALTAGVELLIPLLLLRRKTRTLGVLVALVFHGVLSFDLDQHIFDFTGTLYPLFLLWLPDSVTARLGRPMPPRLQTITGSMLAGLVVASVLPETRLTLVLLTKAFFILWIPSVIGLILWVAWQGGRTAERTYRPSSPVAWFLVGVVVLNGLAPYLEIKTANGWNMYSNLAIVDGESNHFIVRTGIPVSTAQRDPVEILSTDDPGLAAYIGSGYLLPRRNFLNYLADHPEVEVEYRQNGVTRTARGSEIGSDLPLLVDKFALLRAIDAQDPVRCERIWLPAR